MTQDHLADRLHTSWQLPQYAKAAQIFRCPLDPLQDQGSLSYAYNLWGNLGGAALNCSAIDSPAGLVIIGEWHRQNLGMFNISHHSVGPVFPVLKNVIGESWHIDGTKRFIRDYYGLFMQPHTPIHGNKSKVKPNVLMHDGHVELTNQASATANDYQIWKY